MLLADLGQIPVTQRDWSGRTASLFPMDSCRVFPVKIQKRRWPPLGFARGNAWSREGESKDLEGRPDGVSTLLINAGAF